MRFTDMMISTEGLTATLTDKDLASSGDKYKIDTFYYTSSAKYGGAPIKFSINVNRDRGEKDPDVNKYLQFLESDLKVLNRSGSKYVEQMWKELFELADEWEMDVKSIGELKQKCVLEVVKYYHTSSSGIFEIWYNSTKYRDDVFGGHSITINITIDHSTNKISKADFDLAG